MSDTAEEITDSPKPDGQSIDSDQIPSFSMLLKQFKMTMEAVLEVVEALTPHVASLDESSGLSIPLPPMSEEGSEKLHRALERLNDEGIGTKSKIGEDPEPSEDPPKLLEGDSAIVFAEGLKAAYEDQPGALRAVGEAFQTVALMPQRQHLLHASLLTMTVGTLETAIAGVGTQHYALHPEALPAEEKEFSLAELAEFDDLQDARVAAISRRVEDLMRSGFDAWDKWFEGLLKESFENLAADRAVLSEAIQRRHIVVHNGGRVSRQYLAKVPGADKDIAVGKELRIDRAYLEAVIEAVTIFGLRLILTSWSKWAPEEDQASGHALDIVYGELVAGRDEVASCIAETAMDFPADERQRLSLQVNYWQAKKRIEGLEAIRQEVEAWDTSALSPLYMAAKPLLLDDFETAFAEIPELIEQGDVKPRELREWPLFREAREHERWVEIETLLPPPEEDVEEDKGENDAVDETGEAPNGDVDKDDGQDVVE